MTEGRHLIGRGDFSIEYLSGRRDLNREPADLETSPVHFLPLHELKAVLADACERG